MVSYKILYWQEIPVQIKVEGDDDEVSLELPPRFMDRVDQLAAQRGLHATDDYLAQWKWSEEEEREGNSAVAVAEELQAEFEAQFNW